MCVFIYVRLNIAEEICNLHVLFPYHNLLLLCILRFNFQFRNYNLLIV